MLLPVIGGGRKGRLSIGFVGRKGGITGTGRLGGTGGTQAGVDTLLVAIIK